jgi:hypothetical protein
MHSTPTTRVLVVANRTAATPWLLQEVEARARAGPCEFALLVPASRGRNRDWTPDSALELLTRAAGRRIEPLEGGPDAFRAIERALRGGRFDEVLVSIPPTRGPRRLRRDLLRRIDALGVPVTAVVPGARPAVDQTVLKVRW